MNKPSIAVLLGTSGTGKGTRVVQLIKFLQKEGFSNRDVHFTHNNKKKQLGIEFPELGLLFVGMITTSNKSGLSSWTSMDYIHSTLGGVQGVPELLKPWFDKGYTLVCEGEPLMQSNRWRPEWLNETYGIENFNFQIFTYRGDRDAYNARIIGRSGKEAGDSGWARESQYDNTFKKVQEELDAFGAKFAVCPVSGVTDLQTLDIGDRYSKNVLNLYNDPLESWGAQMLEWLNLDSFTEPFRAYTAKNPMLRDINGNNPLATTKRLW